MAFKQKDFRKDKPKPLNVRRVYGIKILTVHLIIEVSLQRTF